MLHGCMTHNATLSCSQHHSPKRLEPCLSSEQQQTLLWQVKASSTLDRSTRGPSMQTLAMRVRLSCLVIYIKLVIPVRSMRACVMHNNQMVLAVLCCQHEAHLLWQTWRKLSWCLLAHTNFGAHRFWCVCNLSCMISAYDQLLVLSAEERTTTNPVADDMNACKELYDMTLEIVGQKPPEILDLAMPAWGLCSCNFVCWTSIVGLHWQLLNSRSPVLPLLSEELSSYNITSDLYAVT